MISYAAAGPHADDPKIDRSGFAQTGKCTKHMDRKKHRDHPHRTKDQEKFPRSDKVDHEKVVGNACKHLRTRQRHKQTVTLQGFQGSAACRQGSSRLDSRHNIRRAEQNETTDDDNCTVAPVDPTRQHEK